MTDKKKQIEELAEKDLNKVTGGLTAQIDGIKKPGSDPRVMGKGPIPPKFQDGEDL